MSETWEHRLVYVAAEKRPGGGEATREVRRAATLWWALPVALAATVLASCYGASEQASSLDAAAFQDAKGQLGRMIDVGRAGDAAGAEEAFAEVRGFLQRVNSVLAAMPGEVILRMELFDAVMRIERELARDRRPDVLADIAEDARRSLAEVDELLGFMSEE